MKFTKSAPLWGEITVPGDKSISHRAVMLASLAEGTTEVTNFLKGADCISTIRAFQAMGIDIEEKEDTMDIQLLRRCPGWKRKEKDKIEGSYFISHW